MNAPFPVRKDGKFSVEEYLARIEQKRVRVEVLARAGEWQPTVLDQHEDTPELAVFGFRVGVGALYRGTPLARPAQA